MNKNDDIELEKYNTQLKDHLAFFKKNGITLLELRYPLYYLDALHQLVEEKLKLKLKLGNKKANLSERNDIAAGKHTSYWIFLSKVPLSSVDPDFIYSQNLPNTFSEFCQHTCEGSLDKAVSKIDKLIGNLKNLKYVEIGFGQPDKVVHIDDEAKYLLIGKLIEELNINSSFIRDVEHIVHKDRIRSERKHEYSKNTKTQEEIKNQLPENIAYDSDLNKVLTKLKKLGVNTDNIEYKDKPLHPTPKGQPNFRVAGNCLICPRPSDKTDFYCKPHQNFNKRQALKDRINNAFFNLGYLLEFEKDALTTYLKANDNYRNKSLVIPYDRESFNNICNDYILSRIETHCQNAKSIFRDKAYFLQGWGLHHPQHEDFCVGLTEIKNNYSCDADDNVWQIKHLFMLNEITILSKKHKHTQKIFKNTNGLFAGTETELLPKSIQSDFLDIDDDEIITPYQFTKIVERMSTFELIRLAAGKNLSSLLESSTYREAKLINRFTTNTINALLNAPVA